MSDESVGTSVLLVSSLLRDAQVTIHLNQVVWLLNSFCADLVPQPIQIQKCKKQKDRVLVGCRAAADSPTS